MDPSFRWDDNMDDNMNDGTIPALDTNSFTPSSLTL